MDHSKLATITERAAVLVMVCRCCSVILLLLCQQWSKHWHLFVHLLSAKLKCNNCVCPELLDGLIKTRDCKSSHCFSTVHGRGWMKCHPLCVIEQFQVFTSSIFFNRPPNRNNFPLNDPFPNACTPYARHLK